MQVKVKICGITRLPDALAAADSGADALGFVFYKGSPRCIAVQGAKAIIQALPPWISRVGVFVNETGEVIRQIAEACQLTCIQLHGLESPAFCQQFSLPVVKAFRVQNESILEQASQFETSAWLLDSYVPGQLGGTGAVFNWQWARQAKEKGRPVILAGGLTPENIANAVRSVEPYGVDVSSGVKSSPGIKDIPRMRDFISNAKMPAA
jgi:phosphoribosylanthranilate isomerase